EHAFDLEELLQLAAGALLELIERGLDQHVAGRTEPAEGALVALIGDFADGAAWADHRTMLKELLTGDVTAPAVAWTVYPRPSWSICNDGKVAMPPDAVTVP